MLRHPPHRRFCCVPVASARRGGARSKVRADTLDLGMKRSLALLLAATDAVLAALLGVAVPLCVTAIVWAARGLPSGGGELAARVGANTWLLSLGGGVDITLDAATAVALGAPNATTFPIAIAPLALTALTVGFAIRGGVRAQKAGIARDGVLVSTLVVVILAGIVSTLTATPGATPIMWRALLGAALVYGVPAALAASAPRLRTLDNERPFLATTWHLVKGMGTGFLVASTLILTAAFIAGMGRVLAVFQAMHLDPFGAVAAGIAQLAILPNFLVWALAWSTGPGFEIGHGATASMLGTNLGPLPLVPMFGVIPEGNAPWLLALVAVPFLGVLLGAHSIRFREVRPHLSRGARVGAVMLAGLVLALAAGVLVLLAAGPAGPGRLAWIGPNPLWTMLAVLGFSVLAGLSGVFLPRGFLLGEVPEDERSLRVEETRDVVDEEADDEPAPRRRWFGARAARARDDGDAANEADLDEDDELDESDEEAFEDGAWDAWITEDDEADEVDDEDDTSSGHEAGAGRETGSEREETAHPTAEREQDRSPRSRFGRTRRDSSSRTAGGLKRAIEREDEPDIYADIDLDD